jgi:hypothetical protein
MGVTISLIAMTSVGALAAGLVVRCHRKLDEALSRLGTSLALD